MNTKQDYTKLTPEELTNLGFVHWDEETQLYLFPGLLYNEANQQEDLFDIIGNPVELEGRNLSPTHRAGLLAYGIVPISLRHKSELY